MVRTLASARPRDGGGRVRWGTGVRQACMRHTQVAVHGAPWCGSWEGHSDWGRCTVNDEQCCLHASRWRDALRPPCAAAPGRRPAVSVMLGCRAMGLMRWTVVAAAYHAGTLARWQHAALTVGSTRPPFCKPV